MRKFAITTFAVLYAMLILSASAERSNDWAAREGAALAHPVSGQPAPASGQMEKYQPRVLQTKIVEPEFVVESPREAIAITIQSERHNPLSLFEYHVNWNGRSFASRAPPFLA